MNQNSNVIVLTPDHESTARRIGYPISTYLPYNTDLKKTVVIRWGNGFQDAPIKDPIFSEYEDFENVLNKQKSIELNVNKPEALKVLSRVVNTPKAYFDAVPSRKTVVYRPTSHAKGSGFSLKAGPFLIQKGYYATEFIKTKKEVRVFVCGNRTMTCSREKGKKSDSDVCRSNWAYRKFRKSPKRLHAAALKAAKALNLDLCAFDVIVKGRKYYFLEGNTSPTIEGKSRQFFQQGIKFLIKRKFPHINNRIVELKPQVEDAKPAESKMTGLFKKWGLI